MKQTLHLLANASSPHVRSWVRLLRSNYNLTIADINQEEAVLNESASIPLFQPLARLPRRTLKPFQYVLLAIWLPFFDPRDALVHAHNTSGFGLAALVGGLPYIVTAYGTEIFSSGAKLPLYRLMIHQVLARANFYALSRASGLFALLTLYSFRWKGFRW